jgi:hypothetical protein
LGGGFYKAIFIIMAGGNKNIKPEDGVQFEIGNKAAEKWTEEAALKFGIDLLAWMQAEDENIFFDDFIYLQDHTGKYAGEIYAELPAYLAKKFSSFLNILNICRQIEKTKLKKFSAFDKLNASIAKFLLSAEYGLSDKTQTDITTAGEKLNITISRANGTESE